MKVFMLILLFVSAWQGIVASEVEQESSKSVFQRVVCYFESWAMYREGLGRFTIDDIDPFLCTHMIYSFIGLNMDGTLRFNDYDLEVNQGNFMKFTNLRLANPNLKTMIAIGGWNEGSAGFSAVTRDPGLRAFLVQNLHDFAIQYQFQGVDIDWEYPAVGNDTIPEDKNNFVLFLQELKAKLAPSGLILSAAMGPVHGYGNDVYDIPQISNALDMIHMMTYDFHGSWENVTGNNAPLFASNAEADKSLNIDSVIRHWINMGATPEKIVLGFGTYGHTFTLADPGNWWVGAPAPTPGNAGIYSKNPGTLTYNEICEIIHGYMIVFDDEQKVPFAVQGNQWIGYDDINSFDHKCNFMNQLGLGGGLVWAIDQDDFSGHCGMGRYPLINKLKSCV